MAQERRWKGTVGAVLAGSAIGIFLAPVVTPALARLMRPATKAAIKAGMAIYHRGMETAAELRETVEDVAAEIEAEAVPVGPTAPQAEVHPTTVADLANDPSAPAAPRRARTAVH
jgi:hypothetical protein